METVKIHKLLLGPRGWKSLVFPLLGLFFSFLLLPLVLQVNSDLKDVLNQGGEDDYQYLQISKEVGISTTIGLSSSTFSSDDIAQLKQKEYISEVGEVTSNAFRVIVSVPQGSFDGFMHSVPEDFLDTKPVSFKWEEGDPEIPVIISNQFFTLLNTGILPSQGQPSIPKVALKQVAPKVYLKGDKGDLKMRARVVGFSDRITSVIVPQNFLEWANKTLSSQPPKGASMAILKVKDVGDKRLQKFLDRNDYEVNKEQFALQKGVWIVEVVSVVLGAIALVIAFLSLNSLILFIELLISKNAEKIKVLKFLGYSEKAISKAINKYIQGGVFVVYALAFFIVAAFVYSLHVVVNDLSGVDLNTNFPVYLLTLFVLMVFVSMVILFTSRKKVKRA